MHWEPISSAPKDGSIILVNDTNGGSPWAAAKWLASAQWCGWVYDDEVLQDTIPLGPVPTVWLSGIPPIPE